MGKEEKRKEGRVTESHNGETKKKDRKDRSLGLQKKKKKKTLILPLSMSSNAKSKASQFCGIIPKESTLRQGHQKAIVLGLPCHPHHLHKVTKPIDLKISVTKPKGKIQCRTCMFTWHKARYLSMRPALRIPSPTAGLCKKW